jgi:tungstate transport system ATP-binding protein
MPEQPVFQVHKLRFGYGDVPVLSVDHLEFHANAIHVLLGPNGSGKTTLMKLLNRLLPVPEGSIRFYGSPLEGNEELRERSVYLHQNPLLFSGSVYDNVAYGLKIRKLPGGEIAQRVDEALAVAGLEGFTKRRHNALSGGEIQRVSIARALALRPEVLLFDEPTASVDKENVRRFEQILPRIKERYGTTIIVSTHNLPFAYRICDRLIHLEEGAVAAEGENILPGRMVEDEGGARYFDARGLRLLCPDMEGDFSKAVLDHDRILLSPEALHSSARNNIKGVVEGIEPVLPESGVHELKRVRVRVGAAELSARITGRSLAEMSLEPGRRVWLSFKASSIRLY